MDAKGNIYDYERHSIWNPNDRNHPYHAELLEKYAQKEFRGRVDADTLFVMASLIPAAAAEEGFKEYHCCYDAGTTTYIAYVYSGQGQYELVKLYESGESSGENSSEAAAELTQWLYSIRGGKGNLYLNDSCHCLKDY